MVNLKSDDAQNAVQVCHFNNIKEKLYETNAPIWVPRTRSVQRAAPVTVLVSIYYKSHIFEITTVLLHTGDY